MDLFQVLDDDNKDVYFNHQRRIYTVYERVDDNMTP